MLAYTLPWTWIVEKSRYHIEFTMFPAPQYNETESNKLEVQPNMSKKAT